MEEMSYVLAKKKKNVACVSVRFFLAIDPADFHLAWQLAFLIFCRRYKIFMFFFQRKSSSFVYFSFSLVFSRSVIHVSEDIKI